ncbi:5'/3'-nucleotidase SurE [Nocardioides limicola]|uniref:5'/3'-nucleotidase SurE n=1 Tax=Nocardioides limicola TaxID=2803368 RepID=UPI00193BE1EF|nr:5'/3'-nucleotidase SurE [Nocardioides sp. DJM-14]
MHTFAVRRLRAAVAVVAAAGLAAILLVTPSSGAAAPIGSGQDLSGLRVLLTNDDSAQGRDLHYGTDGKGLYELRRALCAAGADVLVVAPWGQQSGASVSITTPGFSPVALTVQPVTPPAGYAEDCDADAPDVFGVCVSATACTSGSRSATPSDAVRVGVTRFAMAHWGAGPDVVLSGVNFGQNVGTMANHSGTVGAVITARELGVSGIALSAEVPISDLSQLTNVPFTQTAEFTVKLIAELVRQQRLDDLVTLNVNHPFVGAGESLGRPVAAVLGGSTDLALTLTGDVPASGGTYQLQFQAADEEPLRDADTTALGRKDIPITLLDGDWTVTGNRGHVTSLVAALR